jgi:hypothetical protein
MSTEITVAFVQQFQDNVVMLAQQQGSRLRNAVRTDPDFLKGKAGYFERIGATAVQARTSRHQDTPLINTPHSRRRVTLNDYVWADLIDNADRVKLLIDPEGPYAVNAGWAAGRQFDSSIYSAMGGNATSMDEDDSASSVSFPAAQQVAVNNHDYDSGSGDVGLSVGKLIAAKKILMSNGEIDDNAPLFCVANAQQLSKLLSETEVQSRDYNDVFALVQGKVNSFMGFSFIRYETLSTDGSSDELVYCWTPNAIGLAVGQEITTRVTERADKNYSTQVYLDFSVGATRIQEELVVEIACDP